MADKPIRGSSMSSPGPFAATREPIQVWRFRDAPEFLRNLSPCYGDEDWLAAVPPNYEGDDIPWLEDGSRFGMSSASSHKYPGKEGWTVRIGCHA